ncbi:MAG: efflux RND transporter permease subunit, partial [Nitrospinota bacterium]|nr:efflux RND transporter permease subunit [Nitrospinota bacterium]
KQYNRSVKEVSDVIEKENVTIPGGSMELGDYKYMIRLPGEIKDPYLIGDLVLKAADQKPVYIKDVAEVRFGFKDPTSHARLNAVACITLSITKRAGANIIEVSDEIKQLLETEKPKLPRTTGISITADQSKITRSMVDELENNIITGLILVLGVLFLVMNLKVAVIAALAIPFSLMITFMVLYSIGFTLNMVVLFSLILVLGMLVDDAIVIMENIYRHMEEGASPTHAAVEGTMEVLVAVIASTVTTLAAFFPMIFWPGIMGEFMAYLPYTVCIGMTASLFVAMVINPVMSSTLLRVKVHGKKMHEFSDQELGLFLRWYKTALVWGLYRPWSTVGLSVVTLAVVIVLYGMFGKGVEFFPKVEPSKLFVNIEAPTGTSVTASDALSRTMEGAVAQHKDVDVYVTNVGVSSEMFDFGGAAEGPSNKSRVAVDFIERKERTRSTYVTIEEIRKAGASLVGAEVKIQEESHGPPQGAPVNIEISGEDYTALADYSVKVEQALKTIPGVVDVKNDYSLGRPEIIINVDREKAARFGLRTKDIASAVSGAVQGYKASTYREGKDEYDIRVRLRLDRRDAIEKLNELFIRHEGKIVPISSFATITTSAGYAAIAHLDSRKVITVSARAQSGVNEHMLRGQVQQFLNEKLPAPPGIRFAFTGQSKDQQEAQAFLSKAFVAGILLITFILVLEFNSLATPFVILTSVILSTIGALIGLLVTGTPFGIIMTGVGVISLAGVVVKNSIVLLDYTIKLRERGMDKRTALITAGLTRVRPVLLTAITAILALMPVAAGASIDFKKMEIITQSDMADMWGPMAIAIIYGLGFATILTLVVAPVLYSMFDTASVRLFGVSLTHDGLDRGGQAQDNVGGVRRA